MGVGGNRMGDGGSNRMGGGSDRMSVGGNRMGVGGNRMGDGGSNRMGVGGNRWANPINEFLSVLLTLIHYTHTILPRPTTTLNVILVFHNLNLSN